MDSSWHGKCGSAMWQSSTSSSTAAAAAQSSQLLHSHDSRNLMLNAGHNFYRHAMQESGSSTHKVMLEPSFPVNSNTSSFNLAPTEGSPFISFLSGPPSFLQYDTRQLGNLKPFIPSNNVPDNGSSLVFGPPRIGASLAPSLLLSENHDNRCLTVGVDTGPVVSSRMEASAGRSSNSCSRDVRQVASVNGQSSELAKIVNRQSYHGNEQVKGFSSLKAGPLTSPSPRQIGQLHRTASQSLHRLLEGNFFPRHQSSPITTDCPRVFCLYASGALLLSNTGLLGVLCSCHGLHMSISKFSEHSGLLDVNPGYAVHVDSGETIAQWRKIYFHKFGIRIPEDHCGWEWPEGFSAEAGLVKSKGSVPDMLRSVELSNVVGPPGAFLSSGQPWNNVVFTNNPNAGQKLVNEVLPIITQGDAKDSGNFRFIGTSQSNVQAVAANQITVHSMLGCSPMSKLASGPDNGSQSSSTYFDSISKSKSAFISLTNMQKEKNPGKESDAFRFHNLRSGDILDRSAVSSNIELRLGQPSQQNQTLDSNVPAFCAHLISSKDHPPKSLVMEPLIHKTGSARVMDESRQYLKVDAHTAKSSTREPRTINSVEQASEVYNARGTVQTVQVNDCSARGSAMSMFPSHVENPFNGKLQSNMSSNVVDASHVMPKQPLCESLTVKCDPISHPCMKGNIMGTKSSVYESGILKQMEKDKGAHTTFSANVAHELNFGCPMKSMGTLISSCGFGETSHDTCLGTSEKISHPHQLFAMPVDASDGRIPFNYLEKTSCLGRSGYYDHGFIRSVSSLRIGSGPTPPSQTISLGFSSITTTSMNRDGIVTRPCVVDEKSPMLAVREVMEYSNQDHVITSLGKNQDQGGAYTSFSNKVKSSIAIPSRSTNMRDRTSHGSKEDAPELANKSTNSNVTCWMEGGCEKSSHVSAASQEAPPSLGDNGMQCQLLCNSHPIQQPSIRLGGNDNHIGPSCEQGNSCQRMPHAYLPDKYIRVVQQNYLDRNCDLKSKTSLDALKEAAGSLSGRTSVLFASTLDKGCTSPMDKATSVGQIGDLLKPNLNQVNCNTFQWKDVPCKATVMGKVTCKERSPLLLDGRKSAEDQISDPDSRCCNRSSQGAECIKEQEPSCISSKCSAPAVTQTSVKVSIEDSCTDDAQDSRRANNHVVDKGSGIKKCWSSDDAPDSGRSTQFDCFSSKNNLIDEGSPEAFPDRSSRSLIDELRLRNSRVLKKVQKEIHTGLTTQKCEGNIKFGKRKRATKWKRLNASFYSPAKSSGNDDENPNCTGRSVKSYNLEGAHMLCQHSQGRSHNLGPTFKRRSSTSSSSLTIGCKGGLHRFCYNREGVIDCQTLSRACESCIETSEYSRGKRFRSNQVSSVTNQVLNLEAHCTDDEITMKCNSVSRGIVSSNKQVNVSKSNARPIVCGKYGIILNGNTSKAVKIFSLGKILRNTRRCTHGENSTLKFSPAKSLKNTRRQESKWCTGRTSTLKAERDKRGQGIATCSQLDLGNCVEVMEMTGSPCGENNDDVSYMMDKERNSRCEKIRFIPTCGPCASLKSKSKEVRKRSLYEITAKGKDSSCASFSRMKHMDPSQTKCRSSEQSKSTVDMDSFCCVCWNSNNDEANYLLECSRCLIRVHQACYGISIVPKTHWYCRPCRTSSQNIVCVLCGYRGGAMTMALRSHNIVRSLLPAWNLVTEARPENSVSPCEAWEHWLNMEASSRSQFDSDSPSNIRPACINSSLIAVWKKDLRKELHTTKNSGPTSDTMVQNSITAGVVDPTVEQWVHMVCGLWTPGIQCPNVDTMSAFDVSGVSRPKANVVCSICNCPGGSCIRCRVVDCPIHFHPWCAHQKGLLQSEVEGADNEKVGFYGRCELHATQSQCSHDTDLGDTKTNPGEKELTCARTESYKGRKREGVRHNNRRLSDGIAGCLVSQEQLNAWIHINTQKLYTKRLLKLPVARGSDIETDCRKEYTRYKQLKGWKHLVVYKSGIHALGLYTSSFISRGAMVVEYVGEIVGLRVADRRENDYQSGKKLQYKSACYFFRIDKEHIIDATRKGGIARFVNHSCLPNCVAKVITVRNEKKVVFFAERDVYPGEEITYDYHFNHEDEVWSIRDACSICNIVALDEDDDNGEMAAITFGSFKADSILRGGFSPAPRI